MENSIVTLDQMGLEEQRFEQELVQTGAYQERLEQLTETYAEELYDYFRSMTGWNVVGGRLASKDTISLDGSRESRDYFVRRSRTLVRREPLSKQAVRLYTTYSGILRVAFASNNQQAVDTWKDKFWELEGNEVLLSALHRRKLSLRLLTDGELFLALFPAANGEVLIRNIDPLEIPEGNIITDPEDSETPVYYKREVSPTKRDSRPLENVRYYLDWKASDEARRRVDEAMTKEEGAVEPEKVENEEIVIFHVTYDALGLRGNGLLFAVLSYVENFRSFLQDRAAVVKGLATYIRTVTVDGGSKAVSDVASMFRSSLASGSAYETNPPDAAASTYVQNQATKKEETPPITGAGDARNDSRVFRQPIASGVGITEANLTGDPSIGNLASQEQMEGPQLRNFEDYQIVWEEALKMLWKYVLRRNGTTDFKGIQLTIKLPPIIKPTLTDLANVLNTSLQNTLITREEAARLVLSRLGVSDIDTLIKDLEKVEEEKEQKRQEMMNQKQQPPQNGKEQDGEESDTVTREVKEHGNAVTGKCPMCGVEHRLIESHGVRHCLNCNQTYNPLHHDDQVSVASMNLTEAMK